MRLNEIPRTNWQCGKSVWVLWVNVWNANQLDFIFMLCLHWHDILTHQSVIVVVTCLEYIGKVDQLQYLQMCFPCLGHVILVWRCVFCAWWVRFKWIWPFGNGFQMGIGKYILDILYIGIRFEHCVDMQWIILEARMRYFYKDKNDVLEIKWILKYLKRFGQGCVWLGSIM